MVVGAVGDVFVNLWRGSASCPLLEKLRVPELRFAERAGGRMVVFTVMEPTSFEHIMNSAERDAAAAIARDVAPLTRAQAYTFEGSGFRIAVARAAVAGINLLARAQRPSKTFTAVDDAARWTAEVAEGVDAAALTNLVANLRAQL